MNLIQAFILGIVQGLTEFLPVSSSGHLALLQNYFGEVNVGFDVVIHMATLLAIFIFFFKDIISIIKNVLFWKTKSEDFKMSLFILIATIPIALVGWFFRNEIYGLFSNLYAVALGFFISGMFLFTASFANPNKSMNIKNTFLVGLAQVLALIPGLSRSGVTVSTGVLAGMKREKAIRFSFLLAIPAILGSILVNFQDMCAIPYNALIIGFLTAFIFGLAGIFVFVKYLKLKRFRYFAFYCWLMALLTTIFIYVK